MAARSRVPLFRRSLSSSWRSLVGWGLGLTAALALYLPLFPAIGGNADMAALLDTLPPELVKSIGYDQISTGAGYTQTTFYGLLGFGLISIAATIWGSAAIAGDEESGSLELTLAHGVSRPQVVLERTLAVVVRLAALAVLSGLIVILLNDSATLDIDPVNVAAVVASYLGIAILTATAAICVGALTGRRVFATAAGAAVAVVGYTLNAVGNQGSDLEWLYAFSPYHWAFGRSPLLDGADWGGLALLYGSSAALVALAVAGFARRDVSG